MGHVGGKRGAYRVLVGKLDGKRALDRTRRRLGDNMSGSLRKYVMEAWNGWPRIGTNGWLLWTRLRTFGLYKMRVIS